MKRRQLMSYMAAGCLGSLGLAQLAGPRVAQAQTASALTVEWLGHTCFRFSGGGLQVLVNPFQPLGCTAGYEIPAVAADLVLISSRQLDEGAIDVVPGNPQVFFEAGAYQLEGGKQIQGIQTFHDRIEGRRFGKNVVWRWDQAGINILHLGGIADEITTRYKILMGSPDLLLIPVGGEPPPPSTSKYSRQWPEVYTPAEAKQAIEVLQPKLVIPTHYRVAGSAPSCQLQDLSAFLTDVQGDPVRRATSDTITLTRGNLPTAGPVIQLFATS
ncbi:MAG: MBL fold metallo-hydrolase [Cyanobacteria bacterium P01_H01_bin.121]